MEFSVYCPYCGNDLRKRYDCEFCEIDHMGKDCFRDGKHEEGCLLIKHLSLVEIDLLSKTRKDIKDS
jgi:hypothetical protein